MIASYTASRSPSGNVPAIPSGAVFVSATTVIFLTGSTNHECPYTPPQYIVPTDCGVFAAAGSTTSAVTPPEKGATNNHPDDGKIVAPHGLIHHIYANEKALEGYRTGHFPEGAVLIADCNPSARQV